MQVEGRVCGLLLAGGQSRRMGGGDKCLQKLGGKSLLARVIKCARPQVDHIILNANGDVGRFDSYGLKVVKDVVDGFAGPLAGILTGLEWVRENQPECHWVASFACDAPFVPGDLVSRLSEAIVEKKGTLVCASSNGQDQPVFGLWPVALAEDLRCALVKEGIRKVDTWTGRYHLVRANWSTDPIDPFLNVNRPSDLIEAEKVLRAAT
ncbi:MAG: molybdenum cofactor guanylyltransferase MobA [Rhodospirillaceae bacterium]|nr:molybdenum cofactor guanylyltransferase MobA [Rhodospirillaceae bacterium]